MTGEISDAALEQIAQQYLHIETLKTRKWDGYDFHDMAVWCMADALKAAYRQGFEAGQRNRQAQRTRVQTKA